MDLPERIGDYAVERELGAGGMGTVYLARSRGGRTVAVKVARPELAADPHFRARFRAEVDAARRVGGFHTAQVVDADPEAAAPWLATAYIAGPTLSGLLAERGPMDEARLRLLGAALAEALQAIHDCGLIHRDLKPGNIIMADDGPRVLDFGIARALESTRLTSTGAAFGTPGFLAPEQAQGLEVGGAADVFALGAVLVAAAGGHPFGEGTPMVLMYRAVHEPPDLSALPEGVRPVVAACLAKDPAQRPTPKRLLDLLAPDNAPEPAPATAAHPPTQPSPAVPSAPTPTAGSAAASTGGDIAHAATVAAAPRAESPPGFPQQATPSRETKTAPPGKKRTALLAAGVAGALIVLGGAGYGIYASGGLGSDESFPKATHELVIPESIVGGAYGWDIENRLPPDPQPDSGSQRDATHFSADYTVTSTGTDNAAAFRTVQVYGSSGRYKNPEGRRDALVEAMTVTGSETVSDPPRTIRVPGSDVDFRCETVDQKTVCGWGDDNTTVAIAFTPTGSLELAAAETRKIRDDIRRPIAQRP
ncbi:serine/threonine protein kinase [Streptomyces sp. NBC_01077]|uniref:serine/threonine-protein kinase n=1 Tax=Streptomyces sp. NBC_01077 TaxID=2903746 RepID=UPI00386B512E|nr:serine/threonine protein kinase [Streptomyces sp. NBC_01077]